MRAELTSEIPSGWGGGAKALSLGYLLGAYVVSLFLGIGWAQSGPPMSPCNPVWLQGGGETIGSGLYGLLPGRAVELTAVGDTVRFWYRAGACVWDSLAQGHVLPPGQVYSLSSGGDTLYIGVEEGALSVLAEDHTNSACVYAFQRGCSPAGWWPPQPGDTVPHEWWSQWYGGASAQLTYQKRCACYYGGSCYCWDSGDGGMPPTSSPCLWETNNDPFLRVCRSEGLHLAFATYVIGSPGPTCVGATCLPGPWSCFYFVFYRETAPGVWTILDSCWAEGPASCASLPCNVWVSGSSVDRENGRRFFWLPSCLAPGRYKVQPFIGPPSHHRPGVGPAYLEVVDTRVGWTASLAATACAGQSVQVCATIGGAPYVSGYTWTIGGQTVFVPSGPLGPGDTAVVCTTLTLPATPGSFSVSLSVQYEDSLVFCPGCCAPPAYRSTSSGACSGCLAVSHTFQVQEGLTCVLSASPDTVCVGQPVGFSAQASGCGSGGGWTYVWSFGDGQQAMTQTPTVTHTYSAGGSYTATVRLCPPTILREGEAEDLSSCVCLAQTTVQVVSPPEVTLSGPPQMCWDTTPSRFIVSGWQPGDFISWSLSCGAGTPTYVQNYDTLIVLDWGGSEVCIVEVTIRRGPCERTLRRRIVKGSPLATIQGTSPTTCRPAEYWVQFGGVVTQIEWIVPREVSYTLGGSTPALPVLLVSDWGPYRGTGVRICAVLYGAFGCRDTLCLDLASCCEGPDPTRVYVRPVTTSQILAQHGPNAFSCQTYYINDTLYVDRTMEWLNCYFFFGPYGLVWVQPGVQLTIRTNRGACGGCQQGPYWSWLGPCQQRWPGIYAAERALVRLEGLENSPMEQFPVWVVAADTGIWAQNTARWEVEHAVFNRCGVGLYWKSTFGGFSRELSAARVRRTVFTHTDSVWVRRPPSTCPWVDLRDRSRWTLTRPRVTQDPLTKQVRATVGMWVLSGDSLTLTDSLVIFRGLHYGIVGEGATISTLGPKYERIEEEPCRAAEAIRADLRVTSLTLPDKVAIAPCPQPFLCPPGTGLCSQWLERNARRLLRVRSSSFDTVGIGVQAIEQYYSAFTSAEVTDSRFQQGRVALSFIGIGQLDRENRPFTLTLSRNRIQAYGRGIELIRSQNVAGVISQSQLTAAPNGSQGIWISERRIGVKPLPTLTIEDNQIAGYREGIQASLSDGMVLVRRNTITLPARVGASGVAILRATSPLLYQFCQNTLTGLAIPTLTDSCDLRQPAAVRALDFNATQLQFYCNTSSGTPWGYHVRDRVSLRVPIDFRRNTLSHRVHFFYQGTQVQNNLSEWEVGDSNTASASNYFFPTFQVRVGGDMGRIKLYEPVSLSIRAVTQCPIPATFARVQRQPRPCVAAVAGLCGTVPLPPPPPWNPGLAQRLTRPYPRWATFRELLRTPDTTWRGSPGWWSFFQQVEGEPLGQLELAYQQWRAGDPLALSLSQVIPPAHPMEEAFQTVLGYIEKAYRTPLAPGEVQHLWSLATNCPDSVGPAAYLAQELLRWLGADTVFTQPDCAGGVEESRAAPPDTSERPEGLLTDPDRPYLFEKVPYRPIEERVPTRVNPLDTTPPQPLPMYLHLLPNPAELSLTIYYGELPEPEGLLEIYDMQGRRLFWKEIVGREGHQRLNVVHWSRGLYQVILRSGRAVRQETLWIHP